MDGPSRCLHDLPLPKLLGCQDGLHARKHRHPLSFSLVLPLIIVHHYTINSPKQGTDGKHDDESLSRTSSSCRLPTVCQESASAARSSVKSSSARWGSGWLCSKHCHAHTAPKILRQRLPAAQAQLSLPSLPAGDYDMTPMNNSEYSRPSNAWSRPSKTLPLGISFFPGTLPRHR